MVRVGCDPRMYSRPTSCSVASCIIQNGGLGVGDPAVQQLGVGDRVEAAEGEAHARTARLTDAAVRSTGPGRLRRAELLERDACSTG